jgi:hypothetical protein
MGPITMVVRVYKIQTLHTRTARKRLAMERTQRAKISLLKTLSMKLIGKLEVTRTRNLQNKKIKMEENMYVTPIKLLTTSSYLGY